MRLRFLACLLISACGPTPVFTTPPAPDAGRGDAGLPDAGPTDAGLPIVSPANTWTWIPVDGSECGSGARAGIGLNRAGTDDELFLFLQGGGACWNTGTCVPSWQQFGPLCDYGNVCLVDNVGGTQPTATHVIERDPFPADGGGAFPAEIAQLKSSLALDRTRTDNPFRDANYVYVPYCTGDLHAGAAVRSYAYHYDAFAPPSTFQMHFSGAKNMDAYLARLQVTFPHLKRIWVVGVSGGAYGATLNFDRVARAFPDAEVHLLADSAPFVETPRFNEWVAAWNLQFPAGCAGCDAGFPSIATHLQATSAGRRIALLSYDEDKVISWFFYAPPGAANFLNPPTGTFQANLGALEGRYDQAANTRYFVVPGGEHVLFAGYGVVLGDGGVTAPLPSRDGGTNLRAWINAWATGDAGWPSTR